MSGDPAVVGPYRIVGRLGQGGMGTVYLGENPEGQRVAVKVINAELAGDAVFRERFRREVEAARRVRRFCTAPVLDASLDQPPLYVVTEYISGPTLSDAVGSSGPLRGSDLEGVAVGIATALSAIHHAGLVHRDLKPANVMLSSTGPRVIDFGIARALDASTGVTRTGQIVGTPAYMAPEVVMGTEISAASDVFAWGCVVAFAGRGRSPFDGPNIMAVLHNVAYTAPDLSGFHDPTLHSLVERALSKDPAARPSVPELLDRLAGHVSVPVAPGPVTPTQAQWSPPVHFQQGPPTPPPQVYPPSTVGAAPAAPRRNSLVPAVLGAVVAAALAVAATVFIMKSDESGKPPADNAAQQGPGTGGLPTAQNPAPASSTPAAGANPAKPGGGLSAKYLGTWKGTITQPGSPRSPYPVTVVITGGYSQEVIGTSEYPTLGCKGDLKLSGSYAETLLVVERINSGNCVNNVILSLKARPDGGLYYSFTESDSHGDGVLRKDG